MSFDRSVVERAADLARIALTEEEIERFSGQLSVVLDAVSRLASVDTSDVSPTASVLPLADVMREDVVRPSLGVEDVFRSAPPGAREDDMFRVQTILEER